MIEQIISVTIFVIMFAVIISEKIERHLVSLGCGLLMLIIVYGVCMKDPVAIWDTLNLKSFITPSFWYTKGSAEGTSGINWSTIVFIFGMMIMVEGMGRAGFFRWLCLRIASIVNYKLMPVFISFMVMAFTLAMFIDSITVILFLAAVTVELAELLRFSPVPMILAEIFCSNLGGAATMCGDPPNIIIGTSLGYSFYDFIQNTGVIAFIGLLVTIVYFVLHFRKQFKEHGTPAIQDNLPNPGEAIKNKCDFIVSSLIFLCAIILLVSHAITGLTVATIGLLIALLTIIFSGREAFSIIRKIDYKTLLFFVGLFIVVDGLEKTKVLTLISSTISGLCGGRCSEYILKEYSGLVSAFITGETDTKRSRITDKYNMSPEDALKLMKKKDWMRKAYHNYYCTGKWGDSRNYDLCINSSKVGVDGAALIIEEYIRCLHK